jgi:hypothetical protein
MSTSIEYFFNSGKNLHELSVEINEWLGCNLRVSETRPGHEQAWCRFFGMSLDFYAHSLENNGLVDFESFKYQIGLFGPSDVRYIALPLTALLAYFLYCRLNVSDGAIVYDVQTLLARYQEKLFEGYQDLVDAISGKQVKFPQHFVDLESRIPE